MPEQFDPLFRPITIGGRQLRNRIVSLPHGQNRLTPAQLADYLPQLARGSAGMVMLGALVTEPESWRPGLAQAFDPNFTRQLTDVNARIHEADGMSIAQLLHLGVEALPFGAPLLQARSPSTIPGPGGDVPEAMSIADIDQVRRGYAKTASLLSEAGFDGFDVSAGHNYLLHQFLSPRINRRGDGYGGPVEHRMRLLVEILLDLRAAHPALILGVRLPFGDVFPDGLTETDSIAIGARLSALALVDYITVTVPSAPALYVRDGAFPVAGLRDASRRMGLASNCPVIISQRIETPQLAAEILASGDASLIGLARPLIADPEWGRKAQAGESHRIRPCIRAVRCRSEHGCDVNPEAFAAPLPMPLRPPVAARRVAVIGGGPAGCEAALAARAVGCEVTLFEACQRLGGRARLSGAAPFRANWTDYADFLHSEVALNDGIDLRLGQRATAPDVLAANADVVIFATGAISVAPEMKSLTVVSSDSLLRRSLADFPPAIIVMDEGGNWDALCVADAAIAAGSRVVYITPRERPVDRIVAESRPFALARLADGGAEIICSANLCEQQGRPMVAPRYGEKEAIAATFVVWCGRVVRNPVFAMPADWPGYALKAGDCLAPRSLRAATLDGRAIGRQIVLQAESELHKTG